MSLAEARPYVGGGNVARLRPPLNATAFREAMARLAGGVAVVSCWDGGGRPKGLLVSSLTALSTEPPRVLFCVRKAASAHDALLAANLCSLSILAAEDEEEAQRFADTARGDERFAAGAWSLDAEDAPIYRRALVSLAGHVTQRIDAGTHSVFVVNLTRGQFRQAEPLIYFDRAFRTLAQEG